MVSNIADGMLGLILTTGQHGSSFAIPSGGCMNGFVHKILSIAEVSGQGDGRSIKFAFKGLEIVWFCLEEFWLLLI